MRRLTDEEMARICYTAASEARGAAKALEMLWDLILRDAEGVSVVQAAARPGSYPVQDYAIAADQAIVIFDAMTNRPDLPRKIVAGIALMLLDQSPAEYGERPPGR